MKMYKSISLFLFALLICANAFAQKNFYKDAEKKFSSLEYYAAIDLYKAAYKKANKKQKPECLWKTAECYRLINDMKQAEVYYQKAIKAKCEQSTLAILYLADAMKIQEKYPEAMNEYEKYSKEVPTDKRGENGVKSCEQAQKWKDTPTHYKVDNMVQINTKNLDYTPMYAERKKYSTLLFSSTRQGATGDMDDPNIGEPYADIFMTKVDKNGKWSTPAPLPAPISTKVNEAACVLDVKGGNMYFTRCGVAKSKHPKCQIYGTVKTGQVWSDPTLLPFNVDSFNFGHPALSKDEKIMIFASDMQDSLHSGLGGLDLYYSLWDTKKKTWGTPVNLGPDINTESDEAFPFIHDDGSLYFASNGHPGMGGFDIFHASKTGDNKWGKVENMRFPLNSSADDFAIIFEGEKERGYFTSNRAGGKGGDDIYSFYLPPLLFMVEGYVTEETTKLPVPGATVKLLGSDNTSFEIKTDAKGYYKYETNGQARYINGNTSYVLSASALDVKTPDFPDNLLGNPKAKISTVDVSENTNFRQDFVLQKIVKEMRMPLVLFDLDDFTLKHASNPKDSLEYLVKVMTETPNITVELSAHTDYRNDAKYNQTLSYNRAKTCVDYLINEKGIDPNRISPAGYGESKPTVLQTEVTLPSGKVVPKETILSQSWIDKNFPESKNKNDYEYLMQINRRVVFKILRKDYVSKGTEGQSKTAPEIKVTKSKSEGGEGDNKTEWDDQ
ncbi:MAG: OmpA family protein [Bacteroidetes bacterium]|nr:OmpA family protein [Bacteroidota bacterium]